MKKALFLIVALVVLVSLFYILSPAKDQIRLLGKMPVSGLESVFVKVYQEDAFDSSVGLYYEVVDENDSIISPMLFLTGTHDFNQQDTREFFTNSFDSILYVSYINPNDVYAVFDLRSRKHGFSFAADSAGVDSTLFAKLKTYNKHLKNTFTEN